MLRVIVCGLLTKDPATTQHASQAVMRNALNKLQSTTVPTGLLASP